MNILLYVMTMLMLLATLTYAKLENFRSLVGVEAGFTHYMKNMEREKIDEIAEEAYDQTVLSTNAKGDENDRVDASARLSFNLLVDKKARDGSPEAFRQIQELAKTLMQDLFHEENFYKELEERRPNFLNELLQEISQAAEEQLKEQKLRNAADLAKLKLADSELDHAFSVMLKGKSKQVALPAEAAEDSRALKEELDKADEAAEETAMVERSNEAKPEAGNESLLDYITVKKTSKVRVFLASRTLLLSIYGNEAIADNIIERRQELFREARKNKNFKDASAQFKSSFENSGNASSFGEILEFAVTNVDPTAYNKR